MLNVIWNKQRVKEIYGKEITSKIENELRVLEIKFIDTKPDELHNIVSDSTPEESYLILGGHNLFPFHRIKNPTRDGDEFIWTDNFYASTDDDPLLPERAIGRLPDGKNPELFLKQIRRIKKQKKKTGIKRRFGLSALVWEKASRNIYRVISRGKLILSPPETSETIKISKKTRIFYFNLHGSDRTNKWYGQGEGRYPIALSPDNIPLLKDSIVFTEACYGGYILDKNIHDSIALSFLDKGVSCFVGSTTIAYGPPSPPPREADLLAYLFYKEIMKGNSSGKALLDAKLNFFKKMMDTQRFLDGNDKKTLLQFVLYGNPEEILI